MTTPHEGFTRLLTYIEAHRHTAVTLEHLAQVSGLSRFQLIRLFSRVCGKTPMEYVRARKLAGSIPQLLKGERVLDVALDWGFEYEQSYIRAFREVYGITPAQFRRQDKPVPIVEVLRLEEFTVSSTGMLGRPVLQARPAFTLQGRLRSCNYADNLMDGSPLIEGLASCTTDSFRASCRPSPADRFTHEYLIEDPQGSVEWHWPAGEWALFKYIGLHVLNREGVRRMRLMASLVVGTWFRERGGRWNGCFMEQVSRQWPDENYCEVDVCCPLDPFAFQ